MNRKHATLVVIGMMSLIAWQFAGRNDSQQTAEAGPPPLPHELATATFAGGCFWCMEPPFEKLDGVTEVLSGYTGGHVVDPTYEQVCSHTTGHLEAIQIRFDPKKIKFDDLLEVFWRQIDPTDDGGQFVDRGSSYTSAIFAHDEAQRQVAEKSIEKLNASSRFKKSIVTPVRLAGEFYAAEEYHQDYYKKNTLKYKYYRYASGRDRFIQKAWGAERSYKPESTMVATAKPTQTELRKSLTDLQYRVTQEDATEPPFRNEFWNHKKPGIYVDIVSGEPLFSSIDKYESGTGWPSFSRAIEPNHIVEKVDHKLFATRTEVRSQNADSHLGHVFNDGPAPTGKRYCINSAALRFLPANQLQENGLGEYAQMFAVDGQLLMEN